MKVVIALVFVTLLAVVNAQDQETCGFNNAVCGSNECCIRIFVFASCRPLRREGQLCQTFLSCECEPGLECRVQGRLGLRRCQSPGNSTTTMMATETTPEMSTITTMMATETTPEISTTESMES